MQYSKSKSGPRSLLIRVGSVLLRITHCKIALWTSFQVSDFIGSSNTLWLKQQKVHTRIQRSPAYLPTGSGGRTPPQAPFALPKWHCVGFGQYVDARAGYEYRKEEKIEEKKEEKEEEKSKLKKEEEPLQFYIFENFRPLS